MLSDLKRIFHATKIGFKPCLWSPLKNHKMWRSIFKRIRLVYFWKHKSSSMKKVLLFAFSLLLFAVVKAQTEAAAPAEVLLLKETEFDFGKIPQGKPVYHSFEI